MLDNTEFFKPSQLSRSLSVLEALRENNGLTQRILAQKTYMSEAMVNQYIKYLQTNGLLKLEAMNKKQFLYRLTPQGQEFRQNLLQQYCSEMVRIYTQLKDRIRYRLSELLESDQATICILGATEECEMVLSILKQETNANIAALVDKDPIKQGKDFFGHVVTPPEMLGYVDFEYLVLAYFSNQNSSRETIDSLKKHKNFKVLKI